MSGNDVIFWLHGIVIVASLVAAARLWAGRSTASYDALDPALQLAQQQETATTTTDPAAAGRLQTTEHLRRVSDVVERHCRRVTDMMSAQQDAARHLDAAEVALARLLHDVRAVSGIGRATAIA